MESTAATSSKETQIPAQLASFTSYQKLVIAILAFLQFTIILDFMILSPLGAILMPAFHISPAQFGFVVSIYAFSAGASGLLAAGFADRFDRKKLLLFFYSGFILGTLFCALAPNYHMLLLARMITGLFGGVIGSIVFAIITDLFPFQMRGRVMGIIQTAFASSQVLGLPAGLYLSNHWGWHFPFLLIVAISVIVGIIMWVKLKPINEHLKYKTDRHPFHHLKETVTTPRYIQAFAATTLLATGGFMMMPFASAFNVHNVGMTLEQLPMIYMVTGISAIVFGPLLGRASDRFGKFNIFAIGTLIMSVMVVIFTHLSVTPIEIVMLVSVVMWIGISSRMISSQALLSAIPEPNMRGSFMSVNASLQQISGGLSAILAGAIVVEAADGKLEHFDTLGYVVFIANIITLVQLYFIHKTVPEMKAKK